MSIIFDILIVYQATCEPINSIESRMVVNIARPITYDKAQQLALHELTHHVQFVLMSRHLYPSYPEMAVAFDDGPMGMLLEGGAEAAVDLLMSTEERVIDLSSRLPLSLRPRAANIVAVERITWHGLWQCSIRIAREFIDGRLTKAEAIQVC